MKLNVLTEIKANIMKNLLLLLVLSVTFLSSCSYEPGVSAAFAKYSHEQGVTSVSVPGWLIHIAARMTDLEKNEREIISSIDKVKVLSIEDDDLNARINLYYEFQAQINAGHDYEELLVVNEENQNVKIYGKMDEYNIRDMVILIGGDDNALIYVKGKISPELISNMIQKSNSRDFLSLKF